MLYSLEVRSIITRSVKKRGGKRNQARLRAGNWLLDQTKFSSTFAEEFAKFCSIMSFGFANAALPSSNGVRADPTLTALLDTHVIEFVCDLLQRQILLLSLVTKACVWMSFWLLARGHLWLHSPRRDLHQAQITRETRCYSCIVLEKWKSFNFYQTGP